MTCKCGCGAAVRPGRLFLKTHNFRPGCGPTTEQRREWGRMFARQRPREFWQENGAKGGRTSKIKRWAALLEQWQNQSPREALHAAYRAGYHAGHQSRPAAKKRTTEAAWDAITVMRANY